MELFIESKQGPVFFFMQFVSPKAELGSDPDVSKDLGWYQDSAWEWSQHKQ